MNEEQESVSLTVSQTSGIPHGWKTTTAIVRDISKSTKNKGAERQKKSEEKKRADGFVKHWVPAELIELGKNEGWPEVVRRAKAKQSIWRFWMQQITQCCRAFLRQLKRVA